MDSFDSIRMAPDKTFLVNGVSEPEYHRVLSEPGKQYAAYIHQSSETVGMSYTVVPGDYREDLLIELPAGRYRTDWVNPETGTIVERAEIVHAGGKRTLRTPSYRIDIALRMKRF